jgi:hypothetical protein
LVDEFAFEGPFGDGLAEAAEAGYGVSHDLPYAAPGGRGRWITFE